MQFDKVNVVTTLQLKLTAEAPIKSVPVMVTVEPIGPDVRMNEELACPKAKLDKKRRDSSRLRKKDSLTRILFFCPSKIDSFLG